MKRKHVFYIYWDNMGHISYQCHQIVLKCAEYAKTKMHVWCSPYFLFSWLMLSFQIDQCVLNQFISWRCPLQLLLLFLLLFSSWSANDVDCGQVGCDLWAINRAQLEQHWLAQHVFTTPKYISVLSYIIWRFGLVENTLWDKNRAQLEQH